VRGDGRSVRAREARAIGAVCVGIVREVMTASVRRTVTREAGRIAFMGCGIFFETTDGRAGGEANMNYTE